MRQHPANKTRRFFPVKTIFIITVILSVIAITTSAFQQENNFIDDIKNTAVNKDSVESATAFLEVYKVLMNPRCMNCHPAGDRPLQGEDSHIHIMNVQRGKDGHGVYALKCSNCHQPENVPGVHTPPGNPNGRCRLQI
jgi:hypothetical protein